MTYTVPPAPKPAKPRYVRVTDPVEIDAIINADLRGPVGMQDNGGVWWAEALSLAQFRRQQVTFDI